MKRLPSFRLPAPKFLHKDLKTMDDFVAIVRFSPVITVYQYVNTILYVLFFCLASFSMLVDFLYLLLIIPPLKLLLFMLSYSWLILTGGFRGATSSPSSLQRFLFFLGLSIALFSAIWILAQTKQALRDLRGLLFLHRSTPQQRSQFALQRFLRLSLPSWLSSSITYEPTAEELLAVLRTREQATEDQTQALVETFADEDQGDEKAEEAPSLSMLFTITHEANLTILDATGKRVTIKLTPTEVSHLSFFATQPPGTWISKEETRRVLFNRKKTSVFGTQRLRLNQHVIQQARAAQLLPASAEHETTDIQEDDDNSSSLPLMPRKEEDAVGDEEDTTTLPEESLEINLFEHTMEGQRSLWRLNSHCSVSIFPFLSEFYPKVVRAEALSLFEAEDMLSLEQLRQGYHRLRDEYGEGFLADHMKKGMMWPWASKHYKEFQRQCLFILAYANERTRKHLDTCQTREQRRETTEFIAQLYGSQALVAVGIDPDTQAQSSEHDMERCLFYYGTLKKKSAALAVYERYCDLQIQIYDTYQPGEALKQRAEKLFSTSRKKPTRTHS
jgi:hypothetical protein